MRGPHRACAASRAHGNGRAEGRFGLQVRSGRVHHPAGLSHDRSGTCDQRQRACWLELIYTGLSLQHGWTCTRLGSVILLTWTFVKAYARPDPSPRLRCCRAFSCTLFLELSDTRPARNWLPLHLGLSGISLAVRD